MSINLTGTNQSLELVLSATTGADCVVSGQDNLSGALTPISQDTTVAATTSTIVAAPAASHQIKVDDVEITITAANSVSVKVQKNTGGTLRQLYPATVFNPGERLHFTDDMGWRAFTARGIERLFNVGYSLIKAPVLLQSGTTYTPSVNCSAALFEAWGQGGQGGGSGTAGAAAADVGSGGWAGAYGRKFLIGIPGSFTYSTGSASQTGTGTTAGTDGASTTFTINGVTYTIVGGKGGAVGPGSGTSVILTAAVAPIALGTHNCDECYLGAPGLFAVRVSGTIAASGSGGQADGVGQGGRSISADAAGDPGTGVGSGGSGGCSLAATTRAGGIGSLGGLRIWEFTG